MTIASLQAEASSGAYQELVLIALAAVPYPYAVQPLHSKKRLYRWKTAHPDPAHPGVVIGSEGYRRRFK